MACLTWGYNGRSLAMPHFITKNALIRRAYYRLRSRISGGQSDESQIIERLAKDAPRTFVEFGFHPNEFNCAPLARNPDWRGLLVDANVRQISDARSILSDRIDIVEAFLTLENLDFIKSKFPKLGVLSIDVDGNDYWFLKELIDIRPTVICVEYNASFGQEFDHGPLRSRIQPKCKAFHRVVSRCITDCAYKARREQWLRLGRGIRSWRERNFHDGRFPRSQRFLASQQVARQVVRQECQ